jgi:hypothetical protein
MTRITLTHDKQWIVLVLLSILTLEKGLKEVIGIFADHFLVRIVILSIGVPYIGGLIKP